MKHLIEVAHDGAKGSSTQVASFKPIDSSSELWLDDLERFRNFLTAKSIPKEEAQILLTYKTTVTYELLSNLAAQQPPPKGINDLSMDNIQKSMGEQLNARRFVVRER